MSLPRYVKFAFFCLLIALWLTTLSFSANARPQKSLDDVGDKPANSDAKKTDTKKKSSGKGLDEVDTKETKKPESSRSGGKGLDEVDTKRSESSRSGGKGLDEVDTKRSENSRPAGKGLDEVDPAKRKPKYEPPREEAPAVVHKEHRVEPRQEVKETPVKPAETGDNGPGTDYPEMVAIPAGSFQMGSVSGAGNEIPVHAVKLSGFEMGKYEVTNHQFSLFVKATGYQTLTERDSSAKFNWTNYAKAGRDRFPVVMVAWEDAKAYCEWLSKTTGQTYRLPTEAEWEYAARGGSQGKAFPWGDKIESAKANYAFDDSRTSYAEPALDFLKPVGTYEANGYGLYDVIGNVWEWCSDWYNENYYESSPPENPTGPEEGKTKVARGGGWGNNSSYCYVSFRKSTHPLYKSSSLGFRVVKVLSAQTPPAAAPAQQSQNEPAKTDANAAPAKTESAGK
jgi:formylglycine-generating enzyme required for sulfatase activity